MHGKRARDVAPPRGLREGDRLERQQVTGIALAGSGKRKRDRGTTGGSGDRETGRIETVVRQLRGSALAANVVARAHGVEDLLHRAVAFALDRSDVTID